MSIQLTSNRPEDLPLFVTAHISAQGEPGIRGGDFAAITRLCIYSDRASVATTITKYSGLPAELRKDLDGIFFKAIELVGEASMVLSISDPILHREDVSQQDYQRFVTKNSDGCSFHLVRHVFPLVRHVEQTDTYDSSVKKEQVTMLMQRVTEVVNQCFPNQQKAPEGYGNPL